MKKVPLRTCIVTHEKLNKYDLIRVVKSNDNEVVVDLTGKLNGHGVYLKKDLSIIKKARDKKMLDKALECLITEDVYQKLEEIVRSDKDEC